MLFPEFTPHDEPLHVVKLFQLADKRLVVLLKVNSVVRYWWSGRHQPLRFVFREDFLQQAESEIFRYLSAGQPQQALSRLTRLRDRRIDG